MTCQPVPHDAQVSNSRWNQGLEYPEAKVDRWTDRTAAESNENRSGKQPARRFSKMVSPAETSHALRRGVPWSEISYPCRSEYVMGSE